MQKQVYIIIFIIISSRFIVSVISERQRKRERQKRMVSRNGRNLDGTSVFSLYIYTYIVERERERQRKEGIFTRDEAPFFFFLKSSL